MEKAEEVNINGYDKKASVLKKLKYAVLVVLILTVLFFLVGYREDITVENIRYLLKYVDVSPSIIGSENAKKIIFEEDSSSVTGVYRSDFVVVTQNGVSTYDLTAKKGISDSFSLITPSLSVGEKYFAVFDMGENYYAIYNSFSKIHEETTAYPIWDVVFGADGEFALITAEKGYRSALKIYNSDFNNRMNWYTSDKYIVCADIHSSRDAFYLAGCVKNNDKGDFVSSLAVLRDGSEEMHLFLEFESELILDAEFFENGNICVLTDESLRVIDLAGNVLAKESFSSDSLRMFEAGSTHAVIVLNENTIGTEHRVIILNKKGNTLTDTTVDSDIKDISVTGDNILLLGSQKLTSIDADRNKMTDHVADKSYSRVHALTKSRAVLIYENDAYVVSVE